MRVLRRWGAVALLVYAALIAFEAHAFRIIDQQDIVVRINGILTKQSQVTLFCDSPTDQGVTFTLQIQQADGTVRLIVYQCATVLQTYVVSYMGVIANDAAVISSTNYMAHNLANLALINSSVPAYPYLTPDQLPPGGLRKLLELSVTAPNGNWGDYPDSAYVQAVCTAAMAQGEDIFQYSVCGEGPSTADYNNLVARKDQALLGLKAMMGAIEAAQSQQLVVESELHRNQIGQQNWTQMTNARVVADQRALNLTKDKEDAIYASLSRKISAQDAPIASSSAEIAQLAQDLANISSGSILDIQRLAGVEAQLAQQAMQAIADFANYAKLSKKQILAIFRAIEQDQVALYTSLKRWYTQDDVLIAQNAQLQKALQRFRTTPNANGRLLYPFTEDVGRPPANDLTNLGPLLNHMNVADDTIREVVDFSGTVYGVTTRMKYNCGSIYLLRQGIMNPSWRDMLGWIGPPGCDTTWSLPNNPQDPNFCKCEISITEHRCVLRNTLGTPDADAISAFRSGFFETSTDTGCIADGVSFPNDGSGGLDQVTVTTFAALTDVFARIGGRTPYGGNPAPYRFIPRVRASRADVLYVQSMNNASNFMDLAMPVSDDVIGNLVFMYMNTIPLEYQASYDNFNALSPYVDGVCPDGMQQEPVLYNRFPQGAVGQGWKMYLALFSDEYLTVSKLFMSSRLATAQLTIDGTTQVLGGVDISNPYQSYLPADEGMVWNPSLSDRVLYDTYRVELSPHPILREGEVTLDLSRSPAEHRRDVWEYVNGSPFPHKEINPASNYEVALDSDPTSPTYGECLGAARVGGGGWCTMREHTRWQALGVFNDPTITGTMIAREIDATTQQVVTVPSGPISVMIESACPSVLAIAESGVQLSILLRNPLPGTNTIVMSQFGPCRVPGPKTIDIAGGATASVAVYPCGIPGGRDYVKFSTLIAGGYSQCSGLVNLTLGAGAGIDNSTATSWLTTLTINTVQTDVVAVLLNTILDDLHNTSIQIETAARNDYTAQPYQLPNVTLAQMGNIENNLLSAAANATQIATQTSALVTNFSDVNYPFDAELAATDAQISALNDQTTAEMQQLRKGNEQTRLSLDELEQVIPYVQEMVDEFAGFWLSWGTAVITAIKAATSLETDVSARWDKPVPGEPKNDNGWDIFGMALVALGNLTESAIKALAKGLNDLFHLSDIWGFLIRMIVTILVVLGAVALVVFGGYFMVRFCTKVSRAANKAPSALRLDPALIEIHRRASAMDRSVRSIDAMINSANPAPGRN